MLREHDIRLDGRTDAGEPITLRPLTEDDWELLERWFRDPELLCYTIGDDVDATAYSPGDVRGIYRQVSETGRCFVILYRGVPVGECWLWDKNLDRVLASHPGLDCRRIDLMIGEKEYWNRGIGSAAIHLLATYAFEHEGVDVIFTPDVFCYNPGSIRAFQKAGFSVVARHEQPPGSRASHTYDLAQSRQEFLMRRGRPGAGVDGTIDAESPALGT